MVEALEGPRRRYGGRSAVGAERCPAVRLEADPNNNNAGLGSQAGAGGVAHVRSASFALPPRADGFKVLSALAAAASGPLEVAPPPEAANNGHDEAASSSSGGRRGERSVLALKLPGGGTAHLSAAAGGQWGAGALVVAKDDGLTQLDLAAVAAAYAAALASAAAAGPPAISRGTVTSRSAPVSPNGGFGGGDAEATKGQPLTEDEALAALEVRPFRRGTVGSWRPLSGK
jgi:hypothetical protein